MFQMKAITNAKIMTVVDVDAACGGVVKFRLKIDVFSKYQVFIIFHDENKGCLLM